MPLNDSAMAQDLVTPPARWKAPDTVPLDEYAATHHDATAHAWPTIPPAVPSGDTARVRASRFAIWIALLIAMLVFQVREIALGSAYDIFIDEITYLRIVEGVARSGRVTLYGEPFFLHPPAFFFLAAGFWNMLRPSGDTVSLIYHLRSFNVALASVTAALLFVLGWRLGGVLAGTIAALFFVVDPFINKMNSLVLLETAALMWVVVGYAVLFAVLPTASNSQALWHAVRRRRWSPQAGIDVAPPPAWWRTGAVGVAFGLALLTKDMTAFLTALPLAVCLVVGWAVPRRTSAIIIAIMGATYLPYPLVILLSGQWSQFAAQKFRGLQRLAGVIQETGFNRSNGPSFVQSVIAQTDDLGVTYLVIVGGVLAVCLLLWHGGAANYLLATWTGSAYVLLAYCVLFGTLEEQFFYFLVLPALLACAVALSLGGSSISATRHRRTWWSITTALLVCAAVWGGAQWITTRRTPDDGYARVLDYIHRNVAQGEGVASTSETGQFLLGTYSSGPWGPWHDPAQLEAHHPAYLLLDTKQFAWDASEEAQALQQWVGQHGTPVWSFTGNDDRTLILYKLPPTS